MNDAPSDTDIEPYMTNDKQLYITLKEGQEYDVPQQNPYQVPNPDWERSTSVIKRRVSTPERALPLPPLPPAR